MNAIHALRTEPRKSLSIFQAAQLAGSSTASNEDRGKESLKVNVFALDRLLMSTSNVRADVDPKRVRLMVWKGKPLGVSLASPLVFVASDIDFRVSDEDNFGIDTSGVIYNTRPLDYEQSKGYYLLRISAEYKGLYVGTVEAIDDDNDLDAYILQDVRPKKILDRPWNGSHPSWQDIIFGTSRVLQFRSGRYRLCRPRHDSPGNRLPDRRNSLTLLPQCAAYDRIHIKENVTEGTPVLVLLATDKDRGDNGIVSYFLLNNFGKFTIHSSNLHGQISTTKRLDRDGEDKEFYLTVVARDGGFERHQDSCSFKVVVDDINDNPPLFDRQMYEETINTDHIAGTLVLRVTASDRDSGSNAEIAFSLQGNPDDIKYFAIDSDTGIITLASPLEKSMGNRRMFEMRARASDKGSPVLWSTAEVRIQVVSSDDLPPTIVRQVPRFPEVWENTTENTDVLTLCARSNIADSSLVYFTLLNGNTPDTNSDGTFAVRNSRLSIAVVTGFIKARGNLKEWLPTDAMKTPKYATTALGVTVFVASRNLDYEMIQEYSLTIQIVNDRNARLEKKLQVSILDVNDNAPLLQQFDGSVLENVDSMLITTIQAHDKDVSPQFRQLRYSFDPMASGDVRQKFALKSNGELWTTEPLDREEFKQYKIPIRVTDGVPGHERMTIYWITVQDLNDVLPVFDHLNGIYEVELPENREVGKSTGVKLAVEDSDVVNLFEYRIVEGNGEQKFRIDEVTGEILVNKVLDYDHPVYDRNFTLRIRVYDGANPPAEIDVIIDVTNVNDLQPVFEKSNYTFSVTENTDCNVTFGKVSALDPDLPNNVDQNMLYYLSPIELHNFTIDSKTGDLSLKGCLDRESAKKGIMTLYPRANDEGGRGHDADPATVHLVIQDLNDNHPHIHLPENGYAKIMENLYPEDVESITIKLDDVDGGDHGCPCTMEFDPGTPASWLEKFSLQIGRSTYRLIPVASLDREEQKVYSLPFVTQDQTGRRGIRLLTLEVGDENDSPMSDGRSEIKVYNYQVQSTFVFLPEDVLPSMVIGTVYMTDLDDFDLDDKIFEVDETTSSNVANYFKVDRKSGNITLFKGTPDGLYLLRVKVYDMLRVEAAIGEVSISVVDLNFSSVMNSGHSRHRCQVSGGETLYERLREEIARIHEIPRKTSTSSTCKTSKVEFKSVQLCHEVALLHCRESSSAGSGDRDGEAAAAPPGPADATADTRSVPVRSSYHVIVSGSLV
ncbi:LOW QUALITY PROTEIN: DE-cadherin-like [Macrobrachium rosenbergii]|uniref:LOW QUALITY PROTEIN: DE-cadherin-like n=1 Tax=Macrobrachium rosenbergii TaxID=79674 RepID=UPI0034D4ED5D